MNGTHKKAIIGVIVCTFLIGSEIILLHVDQSEQSVPQSPLPEIIHPVTHTVAFLAFGDVNLGRTVGQKILGGNVDHPFEKYSIRNDSADIVFANLECQISDQRGETAHPKYNLIFTAPPEAVVTLKNSGITIVSTANNHALDYGVDALKETIDNLQRANIPFVGTSKQKENLYKPLIIEKNNIKFAIFAITTFVNMTFKNWRDVVATNDTVQLLGQINAIKDSVDVVVLSYHGGIEYNDRPGKETLKFAEWCAANGVDIFLGHHPHVPYGIEKKGKCIIVHSLGNFIFYQPQQYWTQRSYGVKFLITKKGSVTAIDITKFIPVNVSMQTEPLTDSIEIKKLIQRTQQLSTIDLTHYWN